MYYYLLQILSSSSSHHILEMTKDLALRLGSLVWVWVRPQHMSLIRTELKLIRAFLIMNFAIWGLVSLTDTLRCRGVNILITLQLIKQTILHYHLLPVGILDPSSSGQHLPKRKTYRRLSHTFTLRTKSLQ